MKRFIVRTSLLLALPSAAAFAHHPLAGQEMSTFFHGLMSGVGHPLLGFDHLFFVVLVGVAALYTGRALLAPVAYIITMLLGCLLATSGLIVPGVEAVIALTLLVLGIVVSRGRALALPHALALFAVAGVFHGAAFGGAMASAEANSHSVVLAGYLLGLGAIQYAVSVGAGRVLGTLCKAVQASALEARFAGATVAGAGLLLSLEHLEGVVLSAAGMS
jgi:urease accessory protein